MGLISRVKTWIAGEVLTASDLNTEINNIINKFTCSYVDDVSSNAAAMQTTVDPYPGASASLATTLAEEIHRLRYLIAQITGETYWYVDPDTTLAALFMTTRGDMIRRGASGPERFALGSSGQVLKSDGTDVVWGALTSVLAPILLGLLSRSRFTYSDADTITIGPGIYHHSGTSEQLVYWNSDITFNLGSGGSNAASDDLGASQWHYIYLDDSAIVTQGAALLDADCFLNDTTAPTWSAAKHGWYNGNDRCIFAVLTDGDSHILKFYHDGKDFVEFDAQIISMVAADIDTTWTEATLTIPAFGGSAKALISVKIVNGASAVFLYYRRDGSTATVNNLAMCHSSLNNEISSKKIVSVGSTQIMEIAFSGASAATVEIDTDGFFLPEGL